MLSLKLILKGASSLSLFAGLGMLAMGLGLVEVDPQMGDVANVYAEPLKLPLKPLLVAGGITKVLSGLALWDLVPFMSKDLAVLGLATPAALAVYGHRVVEGPAAALPPIIYLIILGSYYFLSSSEKEGDKKEN